MKSNKNGFTLIESLVAITIGGTITVGLIDMASKEMKKTERDSVVEDLDNILKGIDKRLQNDAFELTDWSEYQTANYTFNNTKQVSNFLSTALIARDAEGCGKTNGWVPQKDDPVDEVYKDKFKFVDCGLWSNSLPFNMEAKARLKHDGTYINSFELDLGFKSKDDFEDNFLMFKNVFLKARAEGGAGETGFYGYGFKNATTGSDLTTMQCMTENTNCVLRVSFEGSDQAQEYLMVNGNNNMIGSKVKFQSDIGTNAINTCHRYISTGTGYLRQSDVYCGIGIGYSDPTDLTSAKIGYVELNVESATVNRLFMDKECSFEDSFGAIKTVPCGVYNDSVENKVIAAYDEVISTSALISVIKASIVKTKEMNVKTELTVEGTSTLKGTLDVAKEATFNDLVTISGDASDLNFVVETASTLKDVDIKGALSVDGELDITGDVRVDGHLVVNDTLTANVIKIDKTVTESDLGRSCTSWGNGTVLYYQEGSFSDLAICANNKWKLVNTQPNQIIAFNGSCPSGFEDFTEADARVLIGSGYDSSIGHTYSIGEKGGASKVALTEAQMPAHDHGYKDAYFSEHWGNEGPRNQMGSGDSDWDNNLYTINRTTATAGGNQAHENRMPYYVVNYCIYRG